MARQYQFFYRAVRAIKKMSKTTMPIKVRRVKMKDLDGCCEEKDTYFLIKIDKNLSEVHALDVILHEIAHIDSWKSGTDHGKEWGICYSRLYRQWEKFLATEQVN